MHVIFVPTPIIVKIANLNVRYLQWLAIKREIEFWFLIKCIKEYKYNQLSREILRRNFEDTKENNRIFRVKRRKIPL